MTMSQHPSLDDARPLNPDALDLLSQCRVEWFVAADLSWSRPGPTGNALWRLSERGLLERQSDPTTWGRSRYRLTLAGIAALAKALPTLSDKGEDEHG